MSERKLNSDVMATVLYFITEKQDVTRYCDWEDVKAQVKEYYPELIKALDDLAMAEKMLDIVVESIDCDKCEE